jgi:hypothetical protein
MPFDTFPGCRHRERRVQYFRVQKKFREAAVAALALLCTAGCSSRNPDALTGMNVDENAAMMNADENLTETPASASEQGAAPEADETSNETASAKPPKQVSATNEEANSTETDQILPPDEPTTGNQGEENEEPHDPPEF